MLTILLLFIIFSAIYLTVGILGIVLKLTFGVFKAGFGIAVFIGALALKLLFFVPLWYAIIWCVIIYLIVRGIGAVANKSK